MCQKFVENFPVFGKRNVCVCVFRRGAVYVNILEPFDWTIRISLSSDKLQVRKHSSVYYGAGDQVFIFGASGLNMLDIFKLLYFFSIGMSVA